MHIMSWNPLKRDTSKSTRSDGETSTGASTELDKLIHDFEATENKLKLLYNHAKHVPDTLLLMNKFEKQITENLSSSPDPRFLPIIEEYHSFACQAEEIGEDLVITFQKVLLGPLKEIKQAFVELRQAIKHRDNVKNDVERFQKKISTLQNKEKTGTNLVKLEECKQTLMASQKEAARYENILHTELTKFLTGIVSLFQPSLEAFVRSEILWIQTSDKLISSQLNISRECDKSMQELNSAVEDRFSKIDALSITTETG
ncbi:Bridging integrator 3-like protein [Fragariocoptes setiger]|uniref:Bridging integrator 3-like protein n=1 Tax=Fragariocoptes setiger TaxID=1670756 RepID=A0ABQ7S7D5_9ACAR|nr:Bridging integrator 3-like protein [Fragariocoptes setiger]